MDVGTLLRDVLYAVLITVIPIVVKFAVDFAKTKRLAQETEIGYTVAGRLLLDAVEIVEKVVDTVAQTYVDDLKKKGSFTPESQVEALRLAVQKSVELMAPEVEEFIKESYNDVEEWIKVQIESYIRAKKEFEGAQEIVLG